MGATATTDTTDAALAKIGGFKENSTSGNFQTYLKFTVTNSGGGSVEAARFNSSGNLVFPNGQGIDFSASESGGADNSLLDDYEEGTWSPLDLSPGPAFVSVDGYYTLIGNQVTIWARIEFDSTANGDAVVIGGLPFSKITPRAAETIGVGKGTGIITMITAFNGGTSNQLLLFKTTTTGLYTNADLSTKIIEITGTYPI